MENQPRIDVLIVEGYDLVRTGIRFVIETTTDMSIAGEATNAEDAIRLAHTLSPHVVLLDIKMLGICGADVTRKMLDYDPELKILAITVFEDAYSLSQLIRAGISGYLTKSTSEKELLEAIRSIHVGKRYVYSRLAQELESNCSNKNKNSPINTLSALELQIVLMVVQGFRTDEIADKLKLHPTTVIHNYNKICAKLKVESNEELFFIMQVNRLARV